MAAQSLQPPALTFDIRWRMTPEGIGWVEQLQADVNTAFNERSLVTPFTVQPLKWNGLHRSRRSKVIERPGSGPRAGTRRDAMGMP